jgi:hypothetical protein|tara:strand:+ start:1898 stop:3631 length:1734 start_codon:yes stop_codon:yes gene_type:complete
MAAIISTFDERSSEEIDDRRVHLEDIWRPSHANWGEIDTFYHRTYALWTGVNGANDANTRGEYRPSTPTNIIDHASDQFMGFIPTVHRQPVNPESQAHKDAADSVEEAVRAVMLDAAMRSMFNPWKQVGKHFNAYGYGVIELDLDFTDKTMMSKRSGYWNPIRIMATHPSQVLMNPLEKIPRSAIRLLTMTAADLAALLKQKQRLKHFNKDEAEVVASMTSWEEIEIERDWTMLAHTLKRKNGEILYSERNSWGFIPLIQAFAGYGMEPSALGKNNPEHMAVGILGPVLESIRLEAQNQTAKHSMVIDNAYAPYVSRFPDELQHALETGAIAVGDVADFNKMKLQDVPRWVFESGRELQEDIRRGTFNPGISGFREGGVVTVGQQQILDHAARKKFAGPTIQEEHMASICATWLCRLVDNLAALKGGIGSHGKTLRRSDLYGVHDVSVTFEALDPVLQMQRQELMMREYEIGLASDEDYWQFGSRVENIKERRQRLRQQRIRNHPAIDSRLVAAEAQAMDDVDAEDVEMLRQAASEGDLPLVQGPGGTQQAARPLRQPLGDDVARPARIDSLAGGVP